MAVAAAAVTPGMLREILFEPREQRGRMRRRVAVALRRDREDRERIDAEAESTRETLARLCANHPASTSNAIDSAICAVVSVGAKTRSGLAARLPHALRLQRGVRLDAHELQRRDQAEHERRAEARARAVNAITRRVEREIDRLARTPATYA